MPLLQKSILFQCKKVSKKAKCIEQMSEQTNCISVDWTTECMRWTERETGEAEKDRKQKIL